MSAVIELKLIPRSPNAEFVSLFQRSPLGLALGESHGNVIALNPAMERLMGAQFGCSKSPALSDLIRAQGGTEVNELVEELLGGKRDFFQIKTGSAAGVEAIAGKNGCTLDWTVWRVSETNEPAGHILAAAIPSDAQAVDLSATDVFVMNVSAKENFAGKQHQGSTGNLETIGRLAGGVAHDFNNLLTGVLLYCDLMMATLEPDHRARRYAEEIRNAGLQAGGLIRQLLAVSRPAQGELRPLSLNETVEGLHQLLTRLIGENIELRLRLSSALGLVQMDPTQAQQILLNLVLNARDAMPSGGEITVETSDGHLRVLGPRDQASFRTPTVRCAMLVVSDNGCGMDADTRKQVFEPFFTTKHKKRAAGTGLGLATVHDIVTRHGGLIDVDSAPGRGTRVTVFLPALSPAPSAPTSVSLPMQRDQYSVTSNLIPSCRPESEKTISSQKEERPL